MKLIRGQTSDKWHRTDQRHGALIVSRPACGATLTGRIEVVSETSSEDLCQREQCFGKPLEHRPKMRPFTLRGRR